jgi:hypothetical protein
MKTHRKLRLTKDECEEITAALDLLKDVIEEYGDDYADERLAIISDLLARLY